MRQGARSMIRLGLAGALLAGCSKNDGAAPAAPPANEPAAATAAAPPAPEKAAAPAATSADAAAEAKTFFNQVCVVCHGSAGAGDGPGSANLNPKPRAFADKEWQASVTDEQLQKVILSGGIAVGKSPVMPGSPQLKTKPKVLKALVALVRSFGK